MMFAVLSLLLSVVFINKLLVAGQDAESQSLVENLAEMNIPAGFILLTYLYHSNKKNFLALVTTGITLILTIVRAGRGLIFYYIKYPSFFFSGLFFQHQAKASYYLLFRFNCFYRGHLCKWDIPYLE